MRLLRSSASIERATAAASAAAGSCADADEDEDADDDANPDAEGDADADAEEGEVGPRARAGPGPAAPPALPPPRVASVAIGVLSCMLDDVALLPSLPSTTMTTRPS